jgi:hypothetical protein
MSTLLKKLLKYIYLLLKLSNIVRGYYYKETL